MRPTALLPLLMLATLGCPETPCEGDKCAGETGDSGAIDDQDTDCDQANADVNPDAEEICDGIDNNCDGQVDEGVQSAFYPDVDSDGFGDINAAALEACEAPTGYVTNAEDCDDADHSVYPGAEEVCDHLDNDCDGERDEDVGILRWADGDGDGYGDPTTGELTCDDDAGYVDNDRDCDDTAASVAPDAEELCDELDNDCDGVVDDGVTTDFYVDLDSDGYGDPAIVEPACALPTGYALTADDCDDTRADVYPGAAEVCDNVDQDCDGVIDDGATDSSAFYGDGDGDGYGSGAALVSCGAPAGYVSDSTDCDDANAAVNPGEAELCNAIDDDCDSEIDEDSAADAATWYGDADGDSYGASTFTQVSCTQPSGYVATNDDCDDLDANVYPGAPETCDGVDEDCDGTIDNGAVDPTDFYADGDGDSYGDAGIAVSDCSAPAGYVADATDCDDAESGIHPGATETCDGVDEDCDGVIDDSVGVYTWYADGDGDGYGDAGVTTSSCALPAGYVAYPTDCDDTDASINPGAAETCDGVDEDCDTVVDDGVATYAWYRDADGDTYGDPGVSAISCSAPAGYVSATGDCNDADASIHPAAAETCDGVDEDCDTVADDGLTTYAWYLDADSDTYGDSSSSVVSCSAPAGYVAVSTDCNDADASINPGATEVCDSVDQDCDGVADDGVPTTTWYLDYDGDGYGDATSSTTSCSTPAGYVSTGTDCDDDDAVIFPESDGTCPDGLDCRDILDSGKSVGNGTYTIDPDGSGTGTAPFDVLCEMTLAGGGWTQTIQAYLNTLSTSTSRTYLYSYGSNWYESPSTTMVWSWSTYQAQNGSYSYGTGASVTSSFYCSSSEAGHWGVGCSNGGGATYKVLPIYASSATAATSTICQDRPDVYGAGACRTGVSIWARE